jgi:hypothetical protein
MKIAVFGTERQVVLGQWTCDDDLRGREMRGSAILAMH